MSTPHGNHLGIIGLGLIGGSVALAARRAGWRVSAFDRDGDTTAAAAQENHINDAVTSLASLADCDIILLAVPLQMYEPILQQLAPLLNDTIIITDVGSSKIPALDAARRQFGDKIQRFVPAHPIAGKEQSGWKAANADLFQDTLTILCPEEADSSTVAAVSALWQQLGARLYQMNATDHDRHLAAVSHLPHLLAYTLVSVIDKHDNSSELLRFAAGGFRDFTRIASSDAEMWRDICLSNADNILAMISRYQDELSEFADFIREKNGDALYTRFTAVRHLRQQWLDTLEK